MYCLVDSQMHLSLSLRLRDSLTPSLCVRVDGVGEDYRRLTEHSDVFDCPL